MGMLPTGGDIPVAVKACMRHTHSSSIATFCDRNSEEAASLLKRAADGQGLVAEGLRHAPEPKWEIDAVQNAFTTLQVLQAARAL